MKFYSLLLIAQILYSFNDTSNTRNIKDFFCSDLDFSFRSLEIKHKQKTKKNQDNS
jgi:hypothetical protein